MPITRRRHDLILRATEAAARMGARAEMAALYRETYERQLAILREQLSATQRLLDGSIAREQEARAETTRVATAASFTPPPAPVMPRSFVEAATPRRPHTVDPWTEVPFDDPMGEFKTPAHASILSDAEQQGLLAALKGEEAAA